MLRIGWAKAQAELVAQNRVSKSIQSRGDGPSYVLQVWDYMVEVPGSDGQPTRLVIRVKNPNLELPELGATERQTANAAAKKAKFDAKRSARD
jgi:hypothetical protein